MRLTRPQFTVRRLLIGVAITAVALGVPPWSRRRGESFRQRAIYHAEESEGGWVDGGLTKAQIDRIQSRLAYHGMMAVKYRWAARYPWLPVAPDPPLPE
jgi:hypothetical protein